jgi:hypothetical protein
MYIYGYEYDDDQDQPRASSLRIHYFAIQIGGYA